MVKICKQCNLSLSFENFHKKKDGKDKLHNICKNCRKNENIQKHLKLFELKKQLGGKCSSCRYANLFCLEFHHLENKITEISRLTSSSKIKEEISKCILLCVFCHNIETAKVFEHRKLKSIQKNKNVVNRDYSFVDSIKMKLCCCSCQRTPTEETLSAFHFDHLYDKVANISFLCKQGYSLEAIQKEIDKCQLLCANCHKLKTIEQFDLLKYIK